MSFQLVLQFPGNSLADYDTMIALENRLISIIGDSAEVDGHDSGQGECNIFILTDNPTRTFQQVQPALEGVDALSTLRAAYLRIDSEEYTVLWPEGFTGRFDVL